MPLPGPLVDPFWLSTTMRGESVVFIGSGTGACEAKLLFPPDRILAVTSGYGDVAYTEGRDYLIDRGGGRIMRPQGSRMPHVTPEAIAAADGALTHERVVAVTYTHRGGLWTSPAPMNASARLPRTSARLGRHEPLTIGLSGDSISEGYDSSGFHGVAPHQPAYGTLMTQALSVRHGADVRLCNLATAGWTAADGLCDTDRIAAADPHLVIVAFGMNDACYAEAGEFVGNVAAILSRVREQVRDVEFVVVSPMLPTPECNWIVPSRFEQYRTALAELECEGVAFVDMTSLWGEIAARKKPQDLSGNGLNHPNDFGHRLYAQAIAEVIG